MKRVKGKDEAQDLVLLGKIVRKVGSMVWPLNQSRMSYFVCAHTSERVLSAVNKAKSFKALQISPFNFPPANGTQ